MKTTGRGEEGGRSLLPQEGVALTLGGDDSLDRRDGLSQKGENPLRICFGDKEECPGGEEGGDPLHLEEPPVMAGPIPLPFQEKNGPGVTEEQRVVPLLGRPSPTSLLPEPA